MSPGLEILSVAGLVTVQDGGRPGQMHQGVPRGGALVPELLARANLAVGNDAQAPALEVFGQVRLKVLGARRQIATELGDAAWLETDAELGLKPSHGLRVRYLAFAGGVSVPYVLGGRGTLLSAGLGGFEGRPLRRGDRVSLGPERPGFEASDGLPPPLDLDAPVRVIPGPDLDLFAPSALVTLLSAEWTVLPASDRTGARLAGPMLARRTLDAGVSTPMVQGAIQVPSAGAPVVLGPDHPTTGGYPVLAVVVRADFGRFAARAINATATFVRGDGNRPLVELPRTQA